MEVLFCLLFWGNVLATALVWRSKNTFVDWDPLVHLHGGPGNGTPTVPAEPPRQPSVGRLTRGRGVADWSQLPTSASLPLVL